MYRPHALDFETETLYLATGRSLQGVEGDPEMGAGMEMGDDV